MRSAHFRILSTAVFLCALSVQSQAQWSIGVGVQAENGKAIGTANLTHVIFGDYGGHADSLFKSFGNAAQVKTLVYPSLSLQRDLTKNLSIGITFQYCSQNSYQNTIDLGLIPSRVTNSDGTDSIVVQHLTERMQTKTSLLNSLVVVQYAVYDSLKLSAGIGVSYVLSYELAHGVYTDANTMTVDSGTTFVSSYHPSLYPTSRIGLLYSISLGDRLCLDLSAALRYDLQGVNANSRLGYMNSGLYGFEDYSSSTYRVLSFVGGAQLRYQL